MSRISRAHGRNRTGTVVPTCVIPRYWRKNCKQWSIRLHWPGECDFRSFAEIAILASKSYFERTKQRFEQGKYVTLLYVNLCRRTPEVA